MPTTEHPTADLWASQRERMVSAQCAARGIQDPQVLAAMRRVPRHEFVPDAIRREAYTDHAMGIGHEQTISQPFIVAAMSEALRLPPGGRVLDVGTGSGYQAAVLAEMGAEVYSIERIGPLAERAAAVLARLGYSRVQVRVGDGSLGWPEAAPFDGILVAAAAPGLPPALLGQLVDGGRLVIPEDDGGEQRLRVYTRRGDRAAVDDLGAVRFVPLIGAGGFSAPR